MLLVCVVCSFCGKDFVTLGRHSWRCRQRVHQGEQDHSAQNMANQAPVMNSPNIVISRRSVIKCCCGKICKGARGLKMHQRSCRVIHGLNDELYNEIEEQINIDSENVPELNQSTSHEESPVNDNDVPNLRKGIKLPKSNSEWSTANEYFKFALQSNQPMRSQDLDSNIRLLNNVIYEYFATNLGYTDSIPDNSMVNKYKDCKVKDLKKALKKLKSENSEPDEIKYVSHILRDQLRLSNNNNRSHEPSLDNNHDNCQMLNHDKYVEKNFWGYIKNILNKKDNILPSFNVTQCLAYFNETLAAIQPNKLFTIPSWIPLLPDFKTSIITSEFRTPFISVGRGVLQGDCLSPLLFNMCFNTFIQHIKSDKYRQFGFSFKLLNPIHWFQFADDAAVISSQESENQHLLNRFSIWCQWSNMIIRVDKCSTFGIKKTLTKSSQYLPKLLVNNKLIPAINIGEHFQYLGRYFCFTMSDKKHKSELTSLVQELMTDIDSKPLHPKHKILIYSRYVLTKLSWHFTVTSLSKT